MTTPLILNYPSNESALLGELLEHHRPGEKLPATILRGAERITRHLPQQ